MTDTPKRYEVLEGLPPYGPKAEPFPPTGRATYREGMVVRFYPSHGEPWVGNFMGGLSSLCTIEEHPDGRHLVVISAGAAYIVDPDTPKGTESIGSWYDRVMRDADLLILATPVDFEGMGPEGWRWHSRRVSWDGLRNLHVDPASRTMTGEAWTFADDEWIPFVLHLDSGQIDGGSYNGPP